MQINPIYYEHVQDRERVICLFFFYNDYRTIKYNNWVKEPRAIPRIRNFRYTIPDPRGKLQHAAMNSEKRSARSRSGRDASRRVARLRIVFRALYAKRKNKA